MNELVFKVSAQLSQTEFEGYIKGSGNGLSPVSDDALTRIKILNIQNTPNTTLIDKLVVVRITSQNPLIGDFVGFREKETDQIIFK